MPEPNGRLRLRERMRRHPVLMASTSTTVVAGIVVALVWFQPQTLFFDRVVDEEFPVTAAPEPQAEEPREVDASEAPDVEPATPQVSQESATESSTEVDLPDAADPLPLASGSFSSRSRYSVVGTATTYELPDGSRVLRLEDFESTNGPDLFVYLTVGDEADGDDTLGADFVDLGVLSGNVGNQNYPVPAGVDLDRYDTVVIWCRRFTVGFGAADLIPG